MFDPYKEIVVSLLVIAVLMAIGVAFTAAITALAQIGL